MSKIDNSVVAKFADEFFHKNPGASTTQCMKAMNNSRPRVPPVASIVGAAHREHQQRRLASMMTLPAMPETPMGPRLFIPEVIEVEPEPETDMSSNQKPQLTQDESIKAASRALLEAMRSHGLQSCILTVTDADVGPAAEWEVEYRRKSVGKATL